MLKGQSRTLRLMVVRRSMVVVLPGLTESSGSATEASASKVVLVSSAIVAARWATRESLAKTTASRRSLATTATKLHEIWACVVVVPIGVRHRYLSLRCKACFLLCREKTLKIRKKNFDKNRLTNAWNMFVYIVGEGEKAPCCVPKVYVSQVGFIGQVPYLCWSISKIDLFCFVLGGVIPQSHSDWLGIFGSRWLSLVSEHSSLTNSNRSLPMWPRLWSLDTPSVFQSSQLFWGDHLTEAENGEREESSVGIKGCRTLGCQSALWAFILLLIFYRAANCIFHFLSSAAWFGLLFRTQAYLKSTSQSVNQSIDPSGSCWIPRWCAQRALYNPSERINTGRGLFPHSGLIAFQGKLFFFVLSLLLRQKKWTLQKCCKLWFRWACVPRILHGPSDGILNSFRQAYFSHSEFLALFKYETQRRYGFSSLFFRRSFKIRNTIDGDRRPITWRWPMWPFRCRRILENNGKHLVSKKTEIQLLLST